MEKQNEPAGGLRGFVRWAMTPPQSVAVYLLCLFLVAGLSFYVGTLKPKHQLDQLLFAELLQITSVHPPMDSEFAARGKGVGKCSRQIEALVLGWNGRVFARKAARRK